MTRARVLRACLALAVAATALTWSNAARPASAAPGDGFVEVQVARLLDTRPGATTVDGLFAGTGPVGAGEHVAFDVRGRAGVPNGAAAVAVTVTVTEPTAAGFVTLYPCGVVPIASTVNFRAGQTVANSAITGLSADGRLCVHTMSPTHVVVDVTGAFDGGFVPVPNARLLDTRPGEPTGDGASAGGGLVAANGVVELQVAGRSGVPTGAEAAALTITSTGSTRAGYVTAYPCGQAPLASTLNHARGENRANSLVVPLDAGGRVCLFTLAPTHLVVDVSGYVPSGSPYTPVTPARLADTRLDGVTVDGRCVATGRVVSGTSATITVAGRGGVPATGVGAVMLNVVATGSKRSGFLTAHRADAMVPNASMLNFVPGDTVASSVIAPVDASGRVSLFSNVGAHLVVDVLGWFPGASAGSAADACSGTFADPSQRHQIDVWSSSRTGCTLIEQMLSCWYTGMYVGRLFDGMPAIPQPFGGTLVELAGSGPICALRTDGVVRCRRFVNSSDVVDVQVPRPMTDIVGLGYESNFCGIDDLGNLWCWRVVSDGAAVAQTVALGSRAVGFLVDSPFGESVVLRTADGQGHVLEAAPSGARIASSSASAAPGVPWTSIEAFRTHPSGERCFVKVDGTVVCGASGDLAPAIDVDALGTGWLITATGEGLLLPFDETTNRYRTLPSPYGPSVRPYVDPWCVRSMTSFGRWCQTRPPE